jgi:acetylcholinesterase
LAKTGNTFNCLREANTSEIFDGLQQSIAEAPELFGFDPTIDGSGGLFPDIASKLIKTGHFAHIPFMAGTNLDEGSY